MIENLKITGNLIEKVKLSDSEKNDQAGIPETYFLVLLALRMTVTI